MHTRTQVNFFESAFEDRLKYLRDTSLFEWLDRVLASAFNNEKLETEAARTSFPYLSPGTINTELHKTPKVSYGYKRMSEASLRKLSLTSLGLRGNLTGLFFKGNRKLREMVRLARLFFANQIFQLLSDPRANLMPDLEFKLENTLAKLGRESAITATQILKHSHDRRAQNLAIETLAKTGQAGFEVLSIERRDPNLNGQKALFDEALLKLADYHIPKRRWADTVALASHFRSNEVTPFSIELAQTLRLYDPEHCSFDTIKAELFEAIRSGSEEFDNDSLNLYAQVLTDMLNCSSDCNNSGKIVNYIRHHRTNQRMAYIWNELKAVWKSPFERTMELPAPVALS